MNKKSEKNLPLYGIGPVIVFGQLLIAGGAIAISYKFKWDCYEYAKHSIKNHWYFVCHLWIVFKLFSEAYIKLV